MSEAVHFDARRSVHKRAPMPTVLRIDGHRFFFFSNEGDEPPHIHVESGDNHAKFWLRPVALASSLGYTARELRQLRELVEAHRDLFEAKWHEYFGS
jgi:hypothetical protein